MKRREFVAASSLAVVSAAANMGQSDESTGQQYLELRKYHMLLGDKRNLIDNYMKNAAIPAFNRLGIKPVGVFTVMYGQTNPTLYVLLPHPSLESVATLTRKLLDDKEYMEAGKEFLDTELSNPSFIRMESSLFLAFKGMPTVEVPEAIQNKNSRIFEFRIYESHNDIKAKKKIEMFNEGGEIDIFRKTGLYPVFFGEALLGPNLPNLAYMLGFESMDQRNQNWNQFRDDPGWKTLSQDEQYKDTVSNISDIILRPTSYSQI